MDHTPKPKNRKSEIASIVMLITAVVLFFFASQYYTKGRAIVQTLGVGCLAVGAFFIIKRLTSYTYSICPKDRGTNKSFNELSPAELTFSIMKRTGKRNGVTSVQIPLDALRSVVPLPPSGSEKRTALKGAGKMQLYYFTVTVTAPDASLLIFESDKIERTGIVIEPSESFRIFLEEAAKVNAENE